jgi:hypothetical protein
MKARPRLICVGLACSVLAACGGSGVTSDREQIMSLFSGLYSAMEHGDYATACGYLSQRQQDNVVSSARRVGLDVSSCANGLTSLLKKAGISRAQVAQALGAGPARKVKSISVHDNQATVTFTETANGQTYVETDALVRQGGRWRADQILKRTQTG